MSNVCQKIVAKDYCIGCGVCAGACPSENLEMRDSVGFGYVPFDRGRCLDACDLCLRVCPFADGNEYEDDIASGIYGVEPGVKQCPEAGFYLSSYVGYVENEEHRQRAGSGGIASWFLAELLSTGVVDRVVCVAKTGRSDSLFEYRIMNTCEEILQAGKPAYYPIELSEVLRLIMKTPGKYAVVGLPCFIKALRLAALRNPGLKERLKVCVGLVCGQLCSKGFTELIIRRNGLDAGGITEVCYRSKKDGVSARSYGVSFTDAKEEVYNFSDMRFFWRLWHISALRACTFCDDIFAETADVVFMDAWLPEYISEFRGTNLIIARTEQVNKMLLHGLESGSLHIEPLPIDRVIGSQAGVVRKKRVELAYRLWLRQRESPPVKRVKPVRPPFFERLRLLAGSYAARQNIQALHAQIASGAKGIDIYSRMMAKHFLFQQVLKVPRKLKECILSVLR